MQSNSGGGPFNLNPANEPIGEFLVRRDRELTQQIDALRGQITPKEQEREQVRTAMRALGLSAAEATYTIVGQPVELLTLPGGTLTIKQMVLAALRDHFHKGATPSELRDYMKTAYGRDVDRNSIGPQLARLRERGAVHQHNDGRWSITRAGKTYDYPTSFNANKDEPAEDSAGGIVRDFDLTDSVRAVQDAMARMMPKK